MQCDCIILDGGAAGLAACAALAKSKRKIILIEHSDRVGRKIMASGNGRCNLSNVDMDPVYYDQSSEFVRQVYDATTPEEVLDFFRGLGLMTVNEEGRIYPRTMAAASVLDVLRSACDAPHITIMTDREAVSLSPSRRGGWRVELENGEGIFASDVLCALGGSAAPHLGTDGMGVQLMRELGHRITPLFPALVQLRCEHHALRSLKGVRIQSRITLLVDGKPEKQEAGELLFADYGVSGVCVFQLSGLASKALAKHLPVCLSIHLLPEVENVDEWLLKRIELSPDKTVQQLLTGVFSRVLIQAVLRQAELLPDCRASELREEQRSVLSRVIADFSMQVTGTQGFRQAQVTSGGVYLDEVVPKTMASRVADGIYLAGEVLDVHGPCGGYNLHFAFASGLTAAKAIMRKGAI